MYNNILFRTGLLGKPACTWSVGCSSEELHTLRKMNESGCGWQEEDGEAVENQGGHSGWKKK